MARILSFFMMLRLKIIAVIAVLAGPFAAFFGYQESQRIGKIEKEGVEVAGVPTGGNLKKGRKGSKTYTIVVEYPDAEGRKMSGNFKVTGDFFESITDGDSIIADTVPMKVLAGNPTEAIIIGGSSDDRMMMPFGIGAFLIGGIGTFFMFRQRRGA